MKRSGGRRYYRPEDVNLLRGIRHLLYGQGYTIRGVQRILREQGIKTVQNWQTGAISPMVPAEDDEPDHEEMLRTAIDEEMTDDFEAGDGDDVGEASSHELPSAIASFIDAARHHRTPAPASLADSLSEKRASRRAQRRQAAHRAGRTARMPPHARRRDEGDLIS